MQVAPALIGFELFQKMATVGVEKLDIQILSSMTREEILSKAVKQIAFRGIAYAIIQGRNKILFFDGFLVFLRQKREETNMLEGKALVDDSDMPLKMQIEAMSFASQALDLYDVFDCISIAGYIKKEFDSKYGNGWQCVVGSNFGCFFTHSKGTFIYFTLERLKFLIFKGASSSTSP
ncbi:hypothetical protein PVK06_005476 [Gossypium arboreum]|uniref:Dynein light chain n=10 Tax=Gossypium TaxID=3633 RepID=A0ABR0QUP6_GOSAR|nr:hypothetical protein PVK06_005476 [Gossypium arboreum]